MTGQLGILLMRAIGLLPLRVVRAAGWLLGQLLYVVLHRRRHITRVNLALCFPQLPQAARARLARETFVCFAQTWLDRGWLWHASPAVLARRLTLTGAVDELEGSAPTIVFGPHFYGLDAAAAAVTMRIARRWFSIYSALSNPVIDDWVRRGRLRFGDSRVFTRTTGMKTIVQAVRAGGVLYLLPDMDFGPQDSVFVPFFGVPAATVPSLPRFARLAGAKVVPILPRLTPAGYTVEVLPAWDDFPSRDAVADTALMNARLEDYVARMPAQYYWVHKRFKTRPEGAPPVY